MNKKSPTPEIGRLVTKRNDWMKRFLDALVDAHERHLENRAISKEVRALSKLDDHMLRDLGMSRGMIRTAVRDRRLAERNRRFGW